MRAEERKMIDLIINNWGSIIVVLIIAAVIVVLAYKGKKGTVEQIIYRVVTEVENYYGSGTGSLKLAAAVDMIYPKLPAIIRIFTTSAGIVKMIEDGLAKAKEKWAKNSAIGMYVHK